MLEARSREAGVIDVSGQAAIARIGISTGANGDINIDCSNLQ